MNALEREPRLEIEVEIINCPCAGPFGAIHRQWPLSADIIAGGINEPVSDIPKLSARESISEMADKLDIPNEKPAMSPDAVDVCDEIILLADDCDGCKRFRGNARRAPAPIRGALKYRYELLGIGNRILEGSYG